MKHGKKGAKSKTFPPKKMDALYGVTPKKPEPDMKMRTNPGGMARSKSARMKRLGGRLI